MMMFFVNITPIIKVDNVNIIIKKIMGKTIIIPVESIYLSDSAVVEWSQSAS